MKQKPLSMATMILLLAALTAMAPLAIDAYLPAMPSIAVFYATDIHAIELSLSLFLGAFAIGQIIGGPFSDHFGRRRSILLGISLFSIGTLGVIFSPTIHWMWACRIIEAFGGGLAVVNSSAIIRDMSSGRDSARYLSHMAVIMMMAPLIGPMLGTLFLHLGGWQIIFAFLLVYTLLIGSIIFLRLPETRVLHPDRPSAFKRYWSVISNRNALSFIFSQGFVYGGMFAFITGSPLVYMGYFGVSENLYPILFAANVLTMVVSNRLNLYLLHHFAPTRLLTVGQLLQVVTGVILASYIAFSPSAQLWIYVVLVILFICGQGLIVPNATACTIEAFPNNSATATALLGSLGFVTGAISSTLVGVLGDGTPLPMALIISACAIAGPLMRVLMQYLNRRSQ